MTFRRWSGHTHAQAADEIREQRLAECRQTVEDFIVGLASVMAGHTAALDRCSSRNVVARVTGALAPILSSTVLIRPDFGSHAELRIDADFLDASSPVSAWVDFEDRSMHELDDRLVPAPVRRIRLHLTLSIQPSQVTDLVVQLSCSG